MTADDRRTLVILLRDVPAEDGSPEDEAATDAMLAELAEALGIELDD